MKHAEAVRDQCTERYLLGEMSDGERLDFEEHFFDCRECADDVKASVALVDNARRVFEEDPPEEQPRDREPSARILGFPARVSGPVGTLLAAAVVLIVCGAAFQALYVVPDLERRLAEARAPQAVSWQFLSVSRSAVPEVEVSTVHRRMGFRLSPSSGQSFAYYRCELRDDDGRTVQSAVIPAPPKGEELGLVLTADELSPGPYAVVLSGLDSPDGPVAAPDVSRYGFTLKIVD